MNGELQKQLDDMQAQIEQLNRRVEELERVAGPQEQALRNLATSSRKPC